MSLTRQAPQGVPDKTSNSNIEYTNLELGEHDGRLAYIADLGFHEVKYQGESKGFFQHYALGIEMIGHTVKIDDKEQPKLLWGKAFPIYKDLTETSGEFKAYSVFEPSVQEKDVPDWDAQLGKPCNVIIDHAVVGDNTYDNIKSLVGIPSKYQSNVPEGSITPSAGRTKEVMDAMYGLVKWLYDRQVTNEEHVGTKPTPAPVAQSVVEADNFDDDIPF